MMKNSIILISLITSALSLNAQLHIATGAVGDFPSDKVLIAEQAKIHFINTMQGVDFLENKISTEGVNLSDAGAFNRQRTVIQQAIEKRLAELISEKLDAQYKRLEISRLYTLLGECQSVSCLEDKKNEYLFTKQKDYNGQEIVAYPLDSLRTNVRYGFVEAYKEGFARIKKDQVFGFINVCGDEVVPCQYETADVFNNGRALVKKVVWYFVDGQNNESDQLFNVVDAKALTQGVSIAYFKDGKCALIDNRYDITKKPISAYYEDIKPFFGKEVFKVRIGGKYGLINLDGIVKVEAKYDFIEPSGVSHLFRIGQDKKVGLMDSLWRVKFEPIYSQISDFDSNTGLAVAQTQGGFVILSNKTYKSSNIYKSILPFNKIGLAQVQNDANLMGLIDKELNIIIEPKYQTIGDFNELNLAPVSRPDKKYGFVNEKGEEVLTPQFDEVGKFNKFGTVIVKEYGKDEKGKSVKTDLLYDKNGRPILTKQNDTLGGVLRVEYEVLDSLFNNKYIAVKRKVDDELMGFHLIESGAFKAITTVPYASISSMDEHNFFRIKSGNLWGLMDTTGKIVMLPTYKEIRRPSEGYYAVLNENDKYGFIDKRGKIQIPFDYEDVKSYRNGHCVVTKGREKWGLINKFNAKIVPLYFKAVTENGGQYEMIDDKGVKYIINDKGDCLENCQKFEEIRKKANSK